MLPACHGRSQMCPIFQLAYENEETEEFMQIKYLRAVVQFTCKY